MTAAKVKPDLACRLRVPELVLGKDTGLTPIIPLGASLTASTMREFEKDLSANELQTFPQQPDLAVVLLGASLGSRELLTQSIYIRPDLCQIVAEGADCAYRVEEGRSVRPPCHFESLEVRVNFSTTRLGRISRAQTRFGCY
jgi:hypothetical protein